METILVVEDDPALRKCMQLCLEKEGYEAVGISSFEEARIRLLGDRFDLVIIDYQLSGGKTGLELLVLLKDLNPETPAIVVSGCTERGLADRALEQGAFEFLPKPYGFELLKRTCKNALGSKRVAPLPASHCIRDRS